MGIPKTPSPAGSVLRSAHVRFDQPNAIEILHEALGEEDFALILVFACHQADFPSVMAEVEKRFEGSQVVGCTTAGEISSEGYADGEIVIAALPRALFSVQTLLVPDLSEISAEVVVGDLIRTRAALARRTDGMEHEFCFLAIDGLSLKEDELMTAIAPGLGSMPLFGGSAGDGEEFKNTYVSLAGSVYQNAAVLTLVRTRCPIKVFSLDHLVPTETRMVVTKADTSRRLVHEINAEPAAREYARILGKDPEQLDTNTFASHPVVVRIGGTHHVRAIQTVEDSDDLVFFSAIDEGLVLTLAEPTDMAEHLEREFATMADAGPLDSILACDCLLRRIEAEQMQQTTRISSILRKNHVVGFATYGEQTDSKHVNHTMTGVAFYMPDT
ncbi:MAG: hypothetical protein ACJA06_000509 [Halocynthiibacter sp.]|jgi:hypothetical protein